MNYHLPVEKIKGVCEVQDCTHDAGCMILTKRVCRHHFKKIRYNKLKVGDVVWKK